MSIPVSLSAQVGIAAELPSGAYSNENLGHDEFFDFLLNGSQAYELIPETRFSRALYVHSSDIGSNPWLT